MKYLEFIIFWISSLSIFRRPSCLTSDIPQNSIKFLKYLKLIPTKKAFKHSFNFIIPVKILSHAYRTNFNTLSLSDISDKLENTSVLSVIFHKQSDGRSFYALIHLNVPSILLK